MSLQLLDSTMLQLIAVDSCSYQLHDTSRHGCQIRLDGCKRFTSRRLQSLWRAPRVTR